MIQEIAKLHVDPILKPIGFRRKNLVWNRRHESLIDIITLQKAKYSTAAEQYVTGNVAVCVPEFVDIIFGEIPVFMIEADGIFSVRFSEIKENNFSGQVLDRWWNVSNETEDTVALELSGIVSKSVIPFLNLNNDFTQLQSTINKMKGWQTKTPYFQINKALLYWKMGNQTACAEVLSSISKWPEQVERVRKWVLDHPPA